MNNKECIFCQIVNNEIPANIVYENDKAVAFLDIFPISEGHTIIISKKHFRNMETIPDHDLAELIKVVKKVAVLIHEKLNIDGYNILQNNYQAAGQIINHIHFHVIPRRMNDGKFKLYIPREKAKEDYFNCILYKLQK